MSNLVSRIDTPAREAGRLLEVARMLSEVPELTRHKKEVYSLWIMGYLRHLDHRDLGDPSPKHIPRFLNSLSKNEEVDEETRQQAAEALVFFHECILKDRVREVHGRLDMLSAEERKAILQQLQGPERLLARLVFSTELDLSEALRLRVGDLDLNAGRIVVTDANGATKRIVDLDEELAEDLEQHLKRVKDQHEKDLAEGHGLVSLPDAVEEQFPDAARAWMWQYVFPAERRQIDVRTGQQRRYHMQPDNLIQALEYRTAPLSRALEVRNDEDWDEMSSSESDWSPVYA